MSPTSLGPPQLTEVIPDGIVGRSRQGLVLAPAKAVVPSSDLPDWGRSA